MDKEMKIAICAIVKDENEYLLEWINHYVKLGIKDFILYDNLSSLSINDYFIEIDHELPDGLNIKVNNWSDNSFGSQNRAYLNCCKNNQEYDYVGFFDIDEFFQSKTMNIAQDINDLKSKYGEFNGLGLYWRIYGNIPYFEVRQPISNYTKWFGDKHIKSFVNPKSIIQWYDPHKAHIKGKYIDELGRIVNSPTGEHTSENMWIKHVFTRSKSEWQAKMDRGDANLRKTLRTWDDFYNYNNLCVNVDV